ncbi:MAG TPA: Uma2 family endonuclease [Longimicrobium sp.]|nr:Uma2 family endonuclease [Longimicrobium sp.]
MSVQFAMPHRFTVDEFQRMGEAGIFSPDDRVELIEGEIIEMTPVGSRHVACVIRLDNYFRELLGREVVVSIQNPLQLEGSQPLPDVALLHPRADGYADDLPRPADCLLVVEVADTSFLLDRNSKRVAYARAGIPEYWVVDLQANSVVVHRSPRGADYQTVKEHRVGESFVSPVLGGREVAVQQLVGTAR